MHQAKPFCVIQFIQRCASLVLTVKEVLLLAQLIVVLLVVVVDPILILFKSAVIGEYLITRGRYCILL